MPICSHCGAHFIGNAGTETCLICGYSQDIEYVKDVKAKKAVHDFLERNPQTDGGSKNYSIRKRWSMKD